MVRLVVIVSLILLMLTPVVSAEGGILTERFTDSKCPMINETSPALTWWMGDGVMLAAEQRQEGLEAERCEEFMHETTDSEWIKPLQMEVTTNGSGQDLSILIEAIVEPTTNLSSSVGLRWVITVDGVQKEEVTLDDVVLHYGWTSAFHHSEDDITNWTKVIDAERLTSDGIPTDDNQIWRISVILMLVDDSTGEVLAFDSINLESPSSVADRKSVVPLILLSIGLLAGFVIVVAQERQREVGLPRISGAMNQKGSGWIATIRVTAGAKDIEIRNMVAEAPWKVTKTPKSISIKAEDEKSLEIKMRTDESNAIEAKIHIDIKVEDLGGWIMDLDLKRPSDMNE